MVSLSLVIPVRNRIDPLKRCLDSIAQSRRFSDFEVIVVDDGSREPLCPNKIDFPYSFPLKIIRQKPQGVSAARNRGLQETHGHTVLFVDSDCTLHYDCLKNLMSAVESYPQDPAFQCRLRGNFSTPLGRMDHLRISAVQNCLLNHDGRINYVNTTAFAVRKSLVKKKEFFNPKAQRGEDTLILAQLMKMQKPPRHVANAVASHWPQGNLLPYIIKHFAIGYHDQPSHRVLSRCPQVLLNRSQKRKMLRQMLKIAQADNIPTRYITLVLLAYSFELGGRKAYDLFGAKQKMISDM